MPRKRMIDPSIWTDEGMAALTPRQQLLFIGLFSNADDHGSLRASPLAIRLLFPTIYGDLSDGEARCDLEAVVTAMDCLSLIERDGRDHVRFSPAGFARFTSPVMPDARRSWQRIARKLRGLIFERDGYRCVACGSTERLEADHIQALARGGSNELANLQTLCRSCNRRKWAN